jgi:hypothetical protein
MLWTHRDATRMNARLAARAAAPTDLPSRRSRIQTCDRVALVIQALVIGIELADGSRSLHRVLPRVDSARIDSEKHEQQEQ